METNIALNIENVKKNIEQACLRSGRNPKDVTLIAVSKTKPNEMLMDAYNAGMRTFGENYVQELVSKIDTLPDDIEWHMIGHLQTNKVKYIVGKVAMIHSVDSVKLAREISKEAVRRNVQLIFLLKSMLHLRKTNSESHLKTGLKQ